MVNYGTKRLKITIRRQYFGFQLAILISELHVDISTVLVIKALAIIQVQGS